MNQKSEEIKKLKEENSQLKEELYCYKILLKTPMYELVNYIRRMEKALKDIKEKSDVKPPYHFVEIDNEILRKE